MTADERSDPEPARRPRLDAEARRAQIVDAACDILESGGVGAMSIEDVADAAGVSRSLVYTYFGDRDSMVAEVYVRVLRRVEEVLPPGQLQGIPDDREAVVACALACLEFARSHPAAWRLLVTDSVRRHPLVAEARARRIASLTAGFPGAKPPLVADASWGLLETGVLHWVEQPDLPIGTAAEMLADTLWSGLAEVRARRDGDRSAPLRSRASRADLAADDT